MIKDVLSAKNHFLSFSYVVKYMVSKPGCSCYKTFKNLQNVFSLKISSSYFSTLYRKKGPFSPGWVWKREETNTKRETQGQTNDMFW